MNCKPLAGLIAGGLLLAMSLTTNARADTVFEVVDTISGGPEVKSYAFEIDDLGTAYASSLTDFVFPFDAFEYLSMAIVKGSNLLGAVHGTGSFSFMPQEAGTYTALVFGVPTGNYAMGSYGITVSAVPEAEDWAMLASGLALIALRLRRRERIARVPVRSD